MRRALAAALGIAWLLVPVVSPAQPRYSTRIAGANTLGLSVTNYGFLGNNFLSRAPSLEYPLGSGFEHMARAGVWVGAIALDEDGAFTGVSAAVVDNAQGAGGPSETEFTPIGDVLRERSRLPNSPVYDPDALADQELLAEYDDLTPRAASGNQRERHRPLRIEVRQRTLGFTLPAADDFVVTRLTVVNRGAPLRQVWVALYVQLVSGDKNAYSSWPPSSSSGPGSWYYKTWFEYDSSRSLYQERYCSSLPYPDACGASYAPPWAGVRVLQATGADPSGLRTHFRWWSYAPGDATRDEDVERYALMSNPGEASNAGCAPGQGDCSPIALLSVGPFDTIDPGDSVRVDFAFIGGMTQEALRTHADYAAFAASLDYRLPSAPPSPRLHVEASRGAVDLWWDDSPERAADPTSPAPGGLDFEGYRVYLGTDPLDLRLVAQFDVPDTAGFNTGFGSILAPQPLVVDGRAYRYRHRIGALRDGVRYHGAVTSFDIGDAAVPSLESGLAQNRFQVVPNPAPGQDGGGVVVYPNPYRVEAEWDAGRNARDHWLWFTRLPERCVIRIYSLAGDRVHEARFDGSVYRGENARGLFDPARDAALGAPVLSGASYAWDLITDRGQAAATGLYLWAVEDLSTGSVQRGRLLLVKSDREGLR